MKNLTLIIIVILTINSSFAQRKRIKNNEILVEKIVAILSPSNGKEVDSDLSYSTELYKKYGIKSFEFHKINILDGSDCNFVSTDDGDILPQSLNIGDFYQKDIHNSKKTVYVKAKYNKYFRNEKNPISSKVEVIFYVYKVIKNKRK